MPKYVWVELWKGGGYKDWEIREAFLTRREARGSASMDGVLHPDMEIIVKKFVRDAAGGSR